MRIVYLLVPFLLSACGGDDSNTIVNIGPNDGIYENKEGHSLFFKDEEAYVYLYGPPTELTSTDGNRSIEVHNNFRANEIMATEFTNAQLGDYFIYPDAMVQLIFNSNAVNVTVKDIGGQVFYDNNEFKKNLNNLDFELSAKQYTDYDGELITLTPENKLSMTFKFNPSFCEIKSNIEKKSFYYQINSATIECLDNDEISGEYSGIIYKANNSAVMILRNNDWIFRTTFPLFS